MKFYNEIFYQKEKRIRKRREMSALQLTFNWNPLQRKYLRKVQSILHQGVQGENQHGL